MDILETLKELTAAAGVSGAESAAAETALGLLKRWDADARIDKNGNVIGAIKAAEEGAKTLMLDAHIDQIGFIVTYIDKDGFLKVGSCGGTDLKITAAQSVTVHGAQELRGVISTLPPHVSQDRSKVPTADELAVDIGMTKEQAESVVSLGDRITVDSEFRLLAGDTVSSPSIDDRSGVCAILAALDMIDFSKLKYNLAVCFSAQEETGERGVKPAAFEIQPDEAIAVDVSFGRTPDSAPSDTAKLGSGVMIGVSAALDRGMYSKLKGCAERLGIPHTTEVMPSSTGTNADSIAVSGRGVRCCTLSIPIRYMHTPIETVKLCDIENTAKLIAAYAEGKTDE